MISYLEYISGCVSDINSWIEKYLPLEDESPAELIRAVRYMTLSGGKRIRPLLCLMTCEFLGHQRDEIEKIAVALEFIHTYSLIHDDLPAMDDDDFRRGKPTCHKVFGEAIAILAGDMLLTEAFGLISGIKDTHIASVLKEVSNSASYRGMVGGQAEDIIFTGEKINLAKLQRLHSLKTGALLAAPLVCAGIIAGSTPETIEKLRKLGYEAGLLFQITDDLLNAEGDFEQVGKSVGSDQEKMKNTFVTLSGIAEARKCAFDSAERAMELLNGISGKSTVREYFRMLISDISKRKK